MVINKEVTLTPLHEVVSFHVPAVDVTLDKVNFHIENAEATNDRLQRKEHFDAAFKTLADFAKTNNGKLPLELSEKLYNVLNRYAQLIFYGQEKPGVEEWGFKQSAILSELTLGLQIDQLTNNNILGSVWTNHSTVEDFMQACDFKVTDHLEHFSTLLVDAFNPALSGTDANEPLRTPVFRTLERLAFSYQNITGFKETGEKNSHFHAQLDYLAYTIMTTNLRLAADYAYNRAVFSVNLKNPNDIEAKLANLDDVKARFAALDPENSYEYGSNLARVLNMKARVLHGIRPAESQGYIDQAFEVRRKLTPPEDKKLRWDHFFLLTNIYSGRVTQALDDPKLTREKFLKDVLPLAVLMQKFINSSEAENICHDYFKGHRLVIAKAEFAVKFLQITPDEMAAVSEGLSGQQWY